MIGYKCVGLKIVLQVKFLKTGLLSDICKDKHPDPAGALGIPFDKTALAKGLEAKPDLIAIDGGSTDSGPYYLGTGTSKYSRTATKADWAVLMAARAQANVPLLIGTAGTCGADSAVDWMVDITLEIARERGEILKIATLKSGQDENQIITAFEAGGSPS